MARDGLILGTVTFMLSLVTALVSVGITPAEAARKRSEAKMEVGSMTQPYAGLWVTADGEIRHELLPNGRYVEARGDVEKAIEGRYMILGDHIEYRDDTGSTANGDFKDGILYHAGMVLYRRDSV
ncbi:Atu4866 domain-containing protein [Rhizobium sp.]